ncbi:hypothetical protein ID866_4316 [Astraeus odoratus]|nr:hypothetical protein ID866_4316 [Astraeus odoratus]
MVSLGLRFLQERGEDGQLVYRLDPPIDVFVTYDGKRAPDIAASRYAVRHLVSAEVCLSFVTRNMIFRIIQIDAALASRQLDTTQSSGSSEKSSLFNKRYAIYFDIIAYDYSRPDIESFSRPPAIARVVLSVSASCPPLHEKDLQPGALPTKPNYRCSKRVTLSSTNAPLYRMVVH